MLDAFYGLAVLFALLSLHPYVTYPLSLVLLTRRRPPTPARPDYRPSVAICMSAYNEERVIVAKVEDLIRMATLYGPAKIFIYVDGGDDRTAELLEPYRAQLTVLISKERRGKTAGLKDLVALSDCEVLAFTDANVVVPPDGLIKLVEALATPDVCCASARLVYVNKTEASVSAAGALYWRLEEFIKSLESERVGLVGVDGAMFVIRRQAYSPPPDELIDDLYVSMKALLGGQRVISERSVLVEERGAASWSEEFRRKVRISCQAINVHRALWSDLRRAPPILLYAYLSHRFLKWMMPFSLLFGYCALLAALCLQFGPLWPVSATVAALLALLFGAWVNLPFFRLLATALVSLTGVAFGQIEAVLTHRTYTTWTPASSVRN